MYFWLLRVAPPLIVLVAASLLFLPLLERARSEEAPSRGTVKARTRRMIRAYVLIVVSMLLLVAALVVEKC
ncbi:MAG TPA: hypothetical protein VIN40_05980 [Candidatus Tyrphobacter sp.]